jgi:hypothetical protein
MENTMLIQLLAQHPQALGPILENTPGWVWGLFAALLALGLSQTRSRSVTLPRMALVPLIMTGLSLWGTASAFGRSPQLGYVLLAWTTGAVLMLHDFAQRKEKLVYFAGIDHARFRRVVRPGDRLTITMEVLKLRSRTCKMKGVAEVDGEIAAEAEILSAMADRE